MGFEELKQKQSVMWGTGPYERLPEHHRPALTVFGPVRTLAESLDLERREEFPRPYVLVLGTGR